MALNKTQLKDDIKSILNDLFEIEDPNVNVREIFANRLANAIDTFVKSGQVNTQVTTNAPATGSGIGTIS